MNLRLTLVLWAVVLFPADLLWSASLYYDDTQYAPIQLAWRQGNLNEVENVFPHPLLPGRALVTSARGLLATEDAGSTWTALPGATAEKLGGVQVVAFHPSKLDTYYLGTRSKGVWVTEDGGKSFRQIGSAAAGMASDAIADLIVYPADTSFRTVIAAHGTEAPGFSKSVDGGKTWEVLNTSYSFRRLASKPGSPELILYGAAKEDPDVWNLYTCATPGEYAVELTRDIALNDMTFVPLGNRSSLYVASDRGVFRMEDDRALKALGDQDVNWASISWAWGPCADTLNLYLYNPDQRGLVVTNRDLGSFRSIRGVPGGQLIKEGAVVRSNANGTAFYAAINNALAIGRVDERVPTVSVVPTVLEAAGNEAREREELISALRDFNIAARNDAATAARGLSERVGELGAIYRRYELTVTARVSIQPAAPVSVTMDLSRYGGSPETPLFDDGLHGDGAAGDGVYGLRFFFQPNRLNRDRNDWRPSYPGPVTLGVRASYADGQKQGAVSLVGVYPHPTSFYFWDDWFRSNDVTKYVPGMIKKDGDVAIQTVKNPEDYKFKRSVCSVRIESQKGPWELQIPVPNMKNDFSSYEAISFWIKAVGGDPGQKLYVQLRDIPELAEQVTTEKVEIVAGMSEGGVTSAYRRVILPFSLLLGKNEPPFQISRVGKLILSGEGGAPAAFVINDLQVVAPGDARNFSNSQPSQ